MATSRWKQLALWASLSASGFLFLNAQQKAAPSPQLAKQFLSHRGISNTAEKRNQKAINSASLLLHARAQKAALQAADSSTSPLNNPWTPIGPSAVQTAAYGLVSGRVTSLAVDPSDTSGNTVYVGTTGGGVWKSTNAAGAAGTISFQPLTDTLPAFGGGNLASLSIGALSVQPNNTGVILAGTGDTNDATDSYFGVGILRSADRGVTWSLIQQSQDGTEGGAKNFSFIGEGFSGFAWSTANPQLVVAAASLASASVAAGATGPSSFAGLYYSLDAGQTWQLATITDGTAQIIQSPTVVPPSNDPGNSATSITWNPVRKRFYAAIRFHGYYESTDGITFTRLANQPGVNLFPAQCPANPNLIGSSTCPIFRGVIATQPATGDMFAITVSSTGTLPGIWQDQGLWQDVCASNGNGCTTSQTVAFATQIADTPIDDSGGNIPQGDYNLTLAAVPFEQDTLLFVGTNDIFRCSLANSCAWRNTTNVNSCASAQVAPSEHAIDATFAANGLLYFGNDGGLWRSTDDVNQQAPLCSANDATHFQNLNGGLGSLGEVASFSQDPTGQNIFLAAMGAFGTAAPQTGQSAWAQVLDGEGDLNAIDPENPQNWYATSASPVSINACDLGTECDTTAFGTPQIGNSQVSGDGYGLAYPAAWILDPQDSSQLILGTCRVWRGPAANGTAWSAGNILSPMLDTVQQPFCDGNAQIRSLAASGSTKDAQSTPEMIYAGMAGAYDGGFSVAGHIYSASVSRNAPAAPQWTDLTGNQVVNSPNSTFNPGGYPVSSIYVDPHDSTGNTVYATVQGFSEANLNGSLAYRSQDGGAHWTAITANLPNAPANSIVVDPNNANIVYIALDIGVFVTSNVNQCTDTTQQCWSQLGTGLPNAPVTQLLALNFSTSSLRASTYGRGIWTIPLLSAGTVPTAATLSPDALNFGGQQVNTVSAPQTVTVTNTGNLALTVTSITTTGDFTQTNQCSQPVTPGGTCTIHVTFTPSQTGTRNGVLTVFGNLPGGQVTASLTGNGLTAGNIVLLPGSLDFGNVAVGKTALAQNITISNTGGVNIGLQSFNVTGDFTVSANTCGSSLAPNTGCTVSITFTPTIAGPRIGTFTVTDNQGTQTVQLSGNGQANATAVLSPTALNFSPPQTIGTVSSSQQVTLTNNGDLGLTGISVAADSDFIAVNNCGPSLIGHATCAINVSYAPSQVGPETGTLTVTTILGVQKVTLTGTGIAPPGISATPSTIDFGSQAVTIPSAQRVVTLTNNGGANLTGLTFSLSGSDFSIAGNDCPASQALPISGVCHIDLVFTPTQAGVRSGTLTVNAANLSQPISTLLSGTGEDFEIQINGPSSTVITSGQTATYGVQIIPVNGSTGTILLSCAGAPKNSTCTINPATLNLLNGATSSATVTVATGVTVSSASATKPLWWEGGAALALLLPWIAFGRKRLSWAKAAFIACAVLALFIPVACGVHATGGSSGGTGTQPPPPTGPVTPSGQYTLTITASTAPTNGLQKSVSVTLTVE